MMNTVTLYYTDIPAGHDKFWSVRINQLGQTVVNWGRRGHPGGEKIKTEPPETLVYQKMRKGYTAYEHGRPFAGPSAGEVLASAQFQKAA